MDTPLNAAASTAGSIISGSVFEVPPYQREYSWQQDEVREFFEDLQRSLENDTYFLGLIILTDEGGKKKIVDGQQRIVTLTLLAAALYHEANARKRNALADRLSADFLYSINYETDGSDPRVILSDSADNDTLQFIISKGEAPKIADVESVGAELVKSFNFLRRELRQDLSNDPFKRLGKWTEFITHKLYFAVFIHPNPASAYQVFEVINTRGRDLTTADLLKNYMISQSSPDNRSDTYERWKAVSESFSSDGANTFVQYIRHAVTLGSGHVLPKDLFSFLAARSTHASRQPPTSTELLQLLEEWQPLYMQMVDPSLPGPATDIALGVFGALNRLNVITVRPLMMAMFESDDADEGLQSLLRMVVKRIVVGNLGTGNIERRFAEAARKVHLSKTWHHPLAELIDLVPEQELFRETLKKRTLNKGAMWYIKNSICARSITPDHYYNLHYILPKSVKTHPDFADGELSFWGGTIGNTFLSQNEKRIGEGSWVDFRKYMLDTAAPGELTDEIAAHEKWNSAAIKGMGEMLADEAVSIWYV